MSAFFDRSEALLGSEALARLASARVLVVGVGGVGSWCAEALVRTGVGHVTLMDDDVVAESNVNRQCPATAKTVGRPKVEVMAERLREINPQAEVTAIVGRYGNGSDGESPVLDKGGTCKTPSKPVAERLAPLGIRRHQGACLAPRDTDWRFCKYLKGQMTNDNGSSFDILVDAIDSVDCKARLLLDAFAAGVPVVSSMGAALRTDPTKVRVMRFDKVEGDGLAKALRNRFRKLGEWPGRFPCVCSVEVTSCSDAARRRVHEDGVKGSIMPVTATFGMCLASEALKILTGPRRVRAVISFGSNVEPRREYLERALEAVCAFPETKLVAASDIEETEPVDVPDEFRELKFLNRVAIVETALEPLDFSRRMHKVEDDLGRVRTVRNGPRTIDVDLIAFGDVELSTPELTLPHPRANEREFVTKPWKTLVRREMMARRAAVPPEVRAAKSQALCEKLKGLLGKAKVVCCYEALRTELDLAPFIAFCRAQGVEVVFPHEVAGTDDLPRARRTYAVERAGEVDLWICPGLAFTAKGERLGFGGGWYDRFLAQAKPGARASGVAYAFQLCDALPQGPWDRCLDGVVAV